MIQQEVYLAFPFIFLFIVLIAFVKASFGGGFSVIAMPAFTFLLGGINATVLLGIVVVYIDICVLFFHKDKIHLFDRKHLYIITPTMVLGIIVGVVAFKHVALEIIEFIIAIITLLYAAHWFYKRISKNEIVPGDKSPNSNKILGMICGAISGFTSFVSQAGGPPITLYLLRQDITKTTYLMTSITVFAVGNLIKLFGYGWGGYLNTDVLSLSIYLIPAILLGIVAGKKLHGYISGDRLFLVCHMFLLLSGSILLFNFFYRMITHDAI